MIHIRTKNESGWSEITWHTGDMAIVIPPVEDVEVLEATGIELDEIQHMFCDYQNDGTFSYSIPMPREKTRATWYGDIARTIYANLV